MLQVYTKSTSSLSWLHYNELILSSAFLILDLVHHLHMLLSGNLWLSMASLGACVASPLRLTSFSDLYACSLFA